MSRDRTPPGEAVASRLAARAERPQLQRRAMTGGGEVFEGPLATRALRALGARAMTVDRSIIVGEGFDPAKAESQALYAHEQVHVEGSGGQGSHLMRDAEEVAARAAERMVLHRALQGGTEAGGALAGGSRPPVPGAAATAPGGAVSDRPTPARGYEALRAQGLTHAQIVEKLATACVETLDEEERVRRDRAGDLKGTF